VGNITAHAAGTAFRHSGTGLFDHPEKPADPKGTDSQRHTSVWNSPTGGRPFYAYALFNKSPSQLRLIGARGGGAHGRNQRARRASMPTQPEAALHCVALGVFSGWKTRCQFCLREVDYFMGAIGRGRRPELPT
jgi:hypothetical protein